MPKLIKQYNVFSCGVYRANYDKYKDKEIDYLKGKYSLLTATNKVMTTMFAPFISIVSIVMGFIVIFINKLSTIVSNNVENLIEYIDYFQNISIGLFVLVFFSMICVYRNSVLIYIIEDIIKAKNENA